MNLSFHGADQGVTGSCHLVTCAGRKILIDCGLFQGDHQPDDINEHPFGFDPAQVDLVLLTHAHLDHCGRLPLLVKRGFSGRVVATSATRDLARIVLLDSAHLQEEEARRRLRHADRRGEKGPVRGALYTLLDVLGTFDHFAEAASYNDVLELFPGIRATFVDAGHILGSASILLELEEADRKCRLLFSGDLGNAGRPLLRDPVPPRNVDIVVMESTYGDRDHRSLSASVEELYEVLNESSRRSGNVIIPTFALERAQELLYYMREGINGSKLAPSLHVFLDSPMAISATEVFRRHPEAYAPALGEVLSRGIDPFKLPNLQFTREAAESMGLNRIRGGAVIMAGSGMCNGGRVRHHLRHNLGRDNCSIIFVGFAAVGTLGREIIDGARSVVIFGERIQVRAHIHTINGFSAHAGQAELVKWHNHSGAARTVLVHGEPAAMAALAPRLANTQVTMPRCGETCEL